MFSTTRNIIAIHAPILIFVLIIAAAWALTIHFTSPAIAVTQVIEAPIPAAEFDPTAVFDQ